MMRLFAAIASGLLILMTAQAAAFAQGSFETPTAPQPQPAQQPVKPKPEAPAVIPPTNAPAPPPQAAPAPEAIKPPTPAPAAPEASNPPPEKPKHHRAVAIAKPRPLPSEPPRPSVITGSVQVSPMDGSLLVGGQKITLGQLTLRPSPDFGRRLSTWLSRRGGEVRCVPKGPFYECRTLYDADLGTALVISGFGIPQPDANNGYKALAARLQLRATVLGYNPSPALTSLLAGTVNLSCENLFTCRLPYSTGGYNTNNTAYYRQDWRGLVENIVQTGYPNDINYYFLGRAAEEMGAYTVAMIYYEKAYGLFQSRENSGHCAFLRGPACGGINLPMELSVRFQNMQKAASLEF